MALDKDLIKKLREELKYAERQVRWYEEGLENIDSDEEHDQLCSLEKEIHGWASRAHECKMALREEVEAYLDENDRLVIRINA